MRCMGRKSSGSCSGSNQRDLEALGARAGLAAEDAALERAAHVVDDVAVGVGDDLLEVGTRVDAHQPDRLDVVARLLADLAHDGVGHRLAELDRAAGQAPAAVVAAAVEQQALGAEDDAGDAWTDDLHDERY